MKLFRYSLGAIVAALLCSGQIANAQLTLTTANVKSSAAAKKISGIAGQSISAGQVVSLDASTNRFILAYTSGAPANVSGIALTTSASSQPIVVCVEDPDLILGIGGGVSVGDILIAGDVGQIHAVANDGIASDTVTVVLGVVTSNRHLNFHIISGDDLNGL